MPHAPVSEEAAMLVRALVLYSIAEAQSGHATRIEVTANEDRFVVADDGRGHAIEKRVEDTPYLSFIYDHFSFPFGRNAPGPVQLQGIGLSLINRLCSELCVRVTRSVTRLTMVFRGGTLVSQVRDTSPTNGSGTQISGTANRPTPATQEVAERLWLWLSTLRACYPNLSMSYNGQPVHAPQRGA
jgi:DNA gyrase/topoisomerase IV subunit B